MKVCQQIPSGPPPLRLGAAAARVSGGRGLCLQQLRHGNPGHRPRPLPHPADSTLPCELFATSEQAFSSFWGEMLWHLTVAIKGLLFIY